MAMTSTVDAKSRSWLVQHGLTPNDAIASIAALLLCVAYSTNFFIPSWTPRMSVLILIAPFGIAVMVRNAIRGDRLAHASIAVIAAATLSAFFGGGQAQLGIFGTIASETGAVMLAASLGLLSVGTCLSEAGRRALGWSALAGIGLSSAIGLLQMLVQAESGPFVVLGGRASGLTPSSVYFGACAAAACAIVVGRKSVNPKTVAVDVGLALWFGVAVGLSGGRIAAGAAVLFAVIALSVRRNRRSLAAGAGIVVAVALGRIVASTVSPDVGALDRVSLGSGGRTVAWRYALTSFADRPVFGFGPGRFRYAIQDDVTAAFAGGARDNIEGVWFNAHNYMFNLAVTGGMVGLACSAVLFVLIARRARGLLAFGGAALALSWMLQPESLSTFPLALLLLGGACAVNNVQTQRDQESGAAVGDVETVADLQGLDDEQYVDRAVPQRFLWLLLPGLLLGSYLIVVDLSIESATDRTDPDAAAAWARRMPADPLLADVVAQLYMVDIETNPDSAVEAFEWSERSIELQPDRSIWWIRHARRQVQLGDPEGALDSLATARTLEPFSWEAVEGQYFILRSLDRDDDVERLRPLACEMAVIECDGSGG